MPNLFQLLWPQTQDYLSFLALLSLMRPSISPSLAAFSILHSLNRISRMQSIVSHFMHTPTSDHLHATKRVLRYLAGTSSHGLYFSKDNQSSLHGFSDADWSGDNDNFISTNTYIIYLVKHPILWSSKKHRGIDRSSTKPEYRSIANTSAKIWWVCSLLDELGISITSPPVIYCDNIGTTCLCANPIFHSLMKNLALDYHFIQNQITSGQLQFLTYHQKINLLMPWRNHYLVHYSLPYCPRLKSLKLHHLEGHIKEI